MKKLFIMAMAVAAIGFTSCGNKSAEKAEAGEQTTEISAVTEAATEITEQLKEKIAAGDSKAINEIIETATAKVAEFVAKGDAEAAKAYQEKIKTFVEENADKIKAAVGNDETVSKLIDSFANIPTDVESTINEASEKAKEAGEKAVEDAKAAGEKAVEDAKAAAEQKVEEAKQKAADAAAQEVEKAKQKANDAVNNLLKKR